MARSSFLCFLLLFSVIGSGIADKNGGIGCAVCTYLVGMGEQLSQVHSDTIVNVIDKYICKNMPAPVYQKICDSLLDRLGPYLIDVIYEHESPDTVCHKAGLCYQESGSDFCHIFPLPPKVKKLKFHPRSTVHSPKKREVKAFDKDPSWCNLPGLDELCKLYDKFTNGHLPLQDGDTDKFSITEGLRGSYWRGKDCNDRNNGVYPGRKANDADKSYDSNCNGIHGSDLGSGTPFETLFCNESKQLGIVSLGDSASAHFHIPANYFEADKLDEKTFQNLGMVVENEFDWPQLSAMTGFMKNEWPENISGSVKSIYGSLLQNNLCNHRDYQSISVNGAKSSSILNIAKGLSRNQTTDHPVLINLALIGNDVCNGNDDTLAAMTTPADYRKNMVETLKYLDSVVPKGSYVIISGLADGTILWDTMSNRTHPIGSINGDVTYADVYAWLHCLGLTPCAGWMNSNETIRNLTSKRAAELSDVGHNITLTENFNNFKMNYYKYDIDELIRRWEAQGGEAWQIIDEVDGFHPNQNAQYISAGYLVEKLEKAFPEIFKINPNNAKIQKVFGDQGGYL